MATIRDVMTSDPTTLPAATAVVDAARTMRESDIGDVIVLDDSQQICGIVTDRDIVIRTVAEGQDPSQVRLGDICTPDVATLTPGDSIGDAVRLMTDKAIRRLPIVENGNPVGIVSLGDLAVSQDPESGLADISAAPPNS
jgi:signal-transduction protein with cAMP-binding, CBS, and nucleotidyltransferase domain